jgi:protein-L-isoaspartate(D-aspartate) O-methyltransferase
MAGIDGLRAAMVGRLASDGYITDPKVAAAMEKVPRHLFVPPEIADQAYIDSPQPIGGGQTISAPHMVAIMTDLLRVGEDSKVLEVGTGSGYQAAIIAELAPSGRVVTLERIPQLASSASGLLARLGYGNVEVVVSDGTLGHPREAPYDRIIVTAAAPKVPGRLLEQLSAGGIMLVPVGGRWGQTLMEVRKDGSGGVRQVARGGCVFVPLIGEDGW